MLSIKKSELSEWFPAIAYKPVNGRDSSLYEVKCDQINGIVKKRKDWIRVYSCQWCYWRGILKDKR